MPRNKNPVTATWYSLREALAPLYYFTTNVEANMVPLGRSYSLLTNLKKKLSELDEKGNTHAKKLLEIVNQRWSSTAEETMLKLAYFIRKPNLLQWRKEYNEAEVQANAPDATQEQKVTYDKFTDEAINIIQYTIKYGEKMGYNFNDAEEEIKYIIHSGQPKYSIAVIDFWQGVGNRAEEIVDEASKKEITLKLENVKAICSFYCKMLSLPSTEAYCERVFRNMRDLFSFNRQNCADDLIKAQTLVKMHIQMEKENEENFSDIEIEDEDL